MTMVKGAAKSMVNAGRQSCLGLDTISCWNNPNQGARRNQSMTSGMKMTAIRGRKDVPVSLCVANPIRVTTAIANTSPAIKIRFALIIELKPTKKEVSHYSTKNKQKNSDRNYQSNSTTL